jgi:hypothetical protein
MRPQLVRNLPSLFIGFIVIGVGVILTFSRWYRSSPTGAWHWTMVALVVGLMVVYGVALWLRSRTEYAAEGDGETFYYLGFIYTLATLVATFAPLLNSTERLETRQVLGLFGLGLITTFVGLAGRVVFAQTWPGAPSGPEDNARRLGDAYAEAARRIERSTVRIVHAQGRAEGHLNESYTAAIESIRTISDRVVQQFDAMSAQLMSQFAGVIDRVGAQAEATFTELRTRAAREIESASRQAEATHSLVKTQVEALATGTAGAVRSVTEQVVHDFARIATESATELSGFLRQTNGNMAATLQEFEARLNALRLPPEDVGQRLVVILNDLTHRAELMRRATSLVGTAYGELEGTLAAAVQGARDGSRAFAALAVSAEAANTAVMTAKTNVEAFSMQLTQVGNFSTGLEKFPEETATIVAALGTLRGSLSEANSAWTNVVHVTEGASKSIAGAGAALATLEHGSRAAEQSVLNWSGGLTKATVGLQALSEIAERAVLLGNDAVTTQAKLSSQIAGPLADELRRYNEAAGELANRLQEDLRASEEAVRRVHHHLIDASQFILSRIESRK